MGRPQDCRFVLPFWPALAFIPQVILRWHQAPLLFLGAVLCLFSIPITAQSPPVEQPTLTRVTEVRMLSRLQASKGLPFKIRGVVTHVDPIWDVYFVQDADAGIYFQIAPVPKGATPMRFKSGEDVELTGVTGEGGFAPILIVDTVRHLGLKPLPNPRTPPLESLLLGREDSQYVSLSAIVQEVRLNTDHFQLDLRTPAGLFQAFVVAKPGQLIPTNWVDAEVSLTGVCATKFTARSQLIAFQLLLEDLSQVKIIRPAVRDPFTLPLSDLDQILAYRPDQRHGHRVRVAGVVTFSQFQGFTVIQTNSVGLRLRLPESKGLVPGMVVEAVGFPTAGTYGPLLEQVQVRQAGFAQIPEARPVDHHNHDGSLDALRVVVKGEVMSLRTLDHGRGLVLKDEDHFFRVWCPDPVTQMERNSLRLGGKIRLTGVAIYDSGYNQMPGGLSVHLQSYPDLEVLEVPAVPTAERARTAAIVLSSVSLLGAVWVISLRRTLRKERAKLAAQVERDIELEKRYTDLAENASDLLYTMDLTGKFTACNPAVVRLFGRTREEILKLKFQDILPAESRELAQQMFARKLGGEDETPPFEVCMRSADGRWVTLEVKSRVIRRDGRVFQIEGVARDVTERQAARDAALQREARLRATSSALYSIVEAPAFRTGELEGVLRLITKAAVDAVQVRRTGIWTYGDDGSKNFVCRDFYDSTVGVHASGMLFPLDGAEEFLAALEGERYVAVEDALADRRTSVFAEGYLRPQQIGAVLDAGIRVDGRLVGCICLEHAGPGRVWAPEEMMFAASLADLASLALESEERRKMAEALKESEARHRGLVSSLAEGVLMLNREGVFIDCNQAAERILGVPADQIKGSSLLNGGWQTIHEDGTNFPLDAYPAIVTLRTGQARSGVVMGIRRPDKVLVWISINTYSIRPDENGVPQTVAVSFADVTARKQAEATLMVSEERYRRLIENTSDLVAEVTEDARFVYVSPSWEAIMGYPSSMLVGQDIFQRIHPEDLVRAQMAFSEEVQCVIRFRHRDGGWRLLESSGRSFMTPAGEKRGVIVSRDITEREQAADHQRKLEQQLYQSQKMEALGTLAGGIAHDFNNILGGILGNADYLRLELPKGDPQHETVQDILKATSRAKDLVAQILAFSRKQETQQRQPTDLVHVVREVLQLMRPTLPRTVEVRVLEVAQPPVVFADPVQMNQVVLNLANNAVQALGPSGGLLEFRFKQVQLEEEDVKARPPLAPGPHVEFVVRDTGHGLEPEVAHRIFEPFFTTKRPGQGTGLGLAVVHGIIRDHEAYIEVQSKRGSGTEFRLLFKAVQVEGAGPVEPEFLNISATGRNEMILLVDDEPSLILMESKLLGKLGYRTEGFTDPIAAREAFSKSPEKFDLVITDLTMPHCTGTELAETVSRVRPGLPILLCTGFGGTVDAAKARQSGIRELLGKPFSAHTLARAVDRLLHDTER